MKSSLIKLVYVNLAFHMNELATEIESLVSELSGIERQINRNSNIKRVLYLIKELSILIIEHSNSNIELSNSIKELSNKTYPIRELFN